MRVRFPYTLGAAIFLVFLLLWCYKSEQRAPLAPAAASTQCTSSSIAESVWLPASSGHRMSPLCQLLANNFQYATDVPSRQAMIDLLAPWAGALPVTAQGEALIAGTAPLFTDPRVSFFIDEVSVRGKSVIELGPLEASHTYMVLKAGARHVTAVEGSPLAYLKCLAVKEIYGLDRASFLFGDFVKYLQAASEKRQHWDAALAIGVLYHMREPVKLLHLLSLVTSNIILWTHFYDAQAEAARGDRHWTGPISQTVAGKSYDVHCHQYGNKSMVFLGGPASSACWLERQSLLNALKDLGFTHVRVKSWSLTHVHGPEITLFASRS